MKGGKATDRILEHPAITRALKTGYPEEGKPRIVCDTCGEPIDYEYYTTDDGWNLCSECLIGEALDWLKHEPEAAAKIMNAERRTA